MGNRNYLLSDDVQRDTSLRPVFDACVSMIVNREILHVAKTHTEKG